MADIPVFFWIALGLHLATSIFCIATKHDAIYYIRYGGCLDRYDKIVAIVWLAFACLFYGYATLAPAFW